MCFNRYVPLGIGGYPDKTESRKTIQKNDSDGKNFYWSTGKSLWDKVSALQEMAKRIGANQESYQFLKSYGIIITADVAPSSSGSPILDASGNVVGMVNLRILPKNVSENQNALPVLNRGLDLDGLKYINHF